MSCLQGFSHAYNVGDDRTFYHCAIVPSGPRPPHYLGFMITLRNTTHGRASLDEWSARRTELYLTTHNTHNKPPTVFEPTIPSKRAAAERGATGISDDRTWQLKLSSVKTAEASDATNTISPITESMTLELLLRNNACRSLLAFYQQFFHFDRHCRWKQMCVRLHNFSKKAAIGSSSPLMEFASSNKLVSSLIDDVPLFVQNYQCSQSISLNRLEATSRLSDFWGKQNNCKTASYFTACLTAIGSHENRDIVHFIIALWWVWQLQH